MYNQTGPDALYGCFEIVHWFLPANTVGTSQPRKAYTSTGDYADHNSSHKLNGEKHSKIILGILKAKLSMATETLILLIATTWMDLLIVHCFNSFLSS